MKIAYIIPEMSYPGGIGRVTAQKANFFASKGHEVTIITEIQGNAPFYYELSDNIKHFDTDLSSYTNKIKKFFARKQKLIAILEKKRPEIVVYTYNILPVKCSFSYKSVLECHFNHDSSLLGAKAFGHSMIKAKFLTKYNEYVASKFDAFVVLTKQDKQLWNKAGIKRKVSVIPNMKSFDCDMLAELKSKRAIAVGRLDAQKSFDRLIHIWSKVHKNNSDWKLYIYGKGPDRGKYENLIHELYLKDIIIICDPVKEIKDEYLKSSFLCCTSMYEGWGLVLTEAMTCGLPVVSYDFLCGPRDIIQNGTDGFIIPDGDEDKFANSVLCLINDEQQRLTMGKNATETMKKYSVNIIMEKWERLFNSLLKSES